MGFPGGSDGKESACNAGDTGLIIRPGRSCGDRSGNPLQHSCLENCMDRGVWWATIHGSQSSDMIKQLCHTHTLYSIGNSIQFLVITYNGKESEKGDIYTYI